MILKTIKVNNFRQFTGEQTIEFASSPDKNITIIHGENGSGKTTLLNAITWCLYDYTGADFEDKRNILSKKALLQSTKGDELECSVVLVFEDSGSEYEAIREIHFKSTGPSSDASELGSSFKLNLKKDGQTKEFDNPEVIIGKIIPKEMHSYFFFNGERIDKLALRENSSEIKEAIKVLLGITILERSIEHILAANKSISKELRENNNVSDQSKELLAKLERLTQDLSDKEKYLEQAKKNIDALNKDNHSISETLRNLEETEKIQAQYDDLNAEQTKLEKSDENVQKSIRKFVTRKACFSFMDDVFVKIDEIFKDLKTSNILPNNVKVDFIQKLLDECSCICSRSLDKDSEEYESVRKLLDYSISRDVDHNISVLKGNLHSIKDKMQSNPKEIDDFLKERVQTSERLDKIAYKLDDLGKALKGLEDREDISKMRIRFEENEQKINEEIKSQGVLENSEIPKLKYDISNLEKRKKTLINKDEQTTKLYSDLEFGEKLKDYTKELYQSRIDEVRNKLSEKINKLFRSICKKDYYIKMNEDFVIDVVDSAKDDARPVGKSTGENQITSLSFIGSVLEFAKEIKSPDNQYGTLISKFGGTYPLVMDSPFGSLDKTYSKNIAESLPTLSEQIVLMVSSTQWRDEVKDGMKSKIGKQYILCNNTPKVGKTPNISLNYNDKEYFFTKTTDGPEFTDIEELK